MHSSMKFMLLSVFLDYSCSNSTCNLPQEINDGRLEKMIKFCPHCGKALEPGNRFCLSCGKEVEKIKSKTAEGGQASAQLRK
ncbi:zinc ribbon domain-containing protein [uncultured Mitsuokella sp.]|uniref:zinc ribbon domain-containing protein n=1 Tax=uncultured Mitsuokella sp. TaxID=453120 RepID=UPI003434B697